MFFASYPQGLRYTGAAKFAARRRTPGEAADVHPLLPLTVLCVTGRDPSPTKKNCTDQRPLLTPRPARPAHATGDSNWLYVCPASTLPWHRSRPRFLPQGGGGADTLTATGSVLRLRGEGGAGDSCTLDGVTKTAGDGSKYSGCE